MKRRELKGIIERERPDFVCVLETKIEVLRSRLCQFIWGDSTFDWAFKPSVGRSGGVLSLWNSGIFQKTAVIEGEGFLCVKGLWESTSSPCAIVNIYSSCFLHEKWEMWSKLEELMAHGPTLNWCFVGVFNLV